MGRERLFGWLESEHLTVFRRNLSRTSALRIAAREARTKCTGFFFNRSARAESGERHGENGRRRASVLREGREPPRQKLQKFCRVPPPVFPHLELDAGRKRPRNRLFFPRSTL